jgi:hypothetical protein
MTEGRKYAIELALKLVAAAIAIFGVARFFVDRAHERELAARGEALTMIERYGGAELRESREPLFDFWLARPEVVAHLEGNAISPRAYRSFLVMAFDSDQQSRALYSGVYTLSSFFDQAFFCFDSEVCDAEMMRRYFCPIAGSLDRLYGPVLGEIRERSGYDAFGSGIEGFARACG